RLAENSATATLRLCSEIRASYLPTRRSPSASAAAARRIEQNPSDREFLVRANYLDLCCVIRTKREIFLGPRYLRFSGNISQVVCLKAKLPNLAPAKPSRRLPQAWHRSARKRSHTARCRG